jgi:hypothetical protein
LPTTPVELDAEVRRCSKLLVVRDLEIGRLVRELFAVGAPKMLKYASKEQYARERIGMSLAALGGSDKDENVTGTGNFCHRPGIHEGRLGVTGTAGNLTWTIGRDPIMVVRGREKKNLEN